MIQITFKLLSQSKPPWDCSTLLLPVHLSFSPCTVGRPSGRKKTLQVTMSFITFEKLLFEFTKRSTWLTTHFEARITNKFHSGHKTIQCVIMQHDLRDRNSLLDFFIAMENCKSLNLYSAIDVTIAFNTILFQL